MENPQGEHIRLGQLISNFVVSDQDAANLAGGELWQTNAEPWMGRDPFCACDRLTGYASGGSRIDGSQEFVEADQIRVRLARPA